jgi:hypothetical protein
MSLSIIRLNSQDDFAVYSNVPWLTGPYDTALLFRGPLNECLAFRDKTKVMA